MVTTKFVTRTDRTAVLKLQGCAEALGWPIPVVGRVVCSYDAGLFEGFLRGVTGDLELTVEEIACLGCGHAACHFAIASSPSAASHGVDHDHH